MPWMMIGMPTWHSNHSEVNLFYKNIIFYPPLRNWEIACQTLSFQKYPLVDGKKFHYFSGGYLQKSRWTDLATNMTTEDKFQIAYYVLAATYNILNPVR